MLQAQSNCFTRLLQCCLPIRQNFAYLRFCKIQISAMSESTQLSQGACVSVNKAVSISDCSERKGQQHGLGRRAVQSRAGQGRAGQGRAGLGRAGQGRAGQGRAGQGRAGQGRAGQGRAGHLEDRHQQLVSSILLPSKLVQAEAAQQLQVGASIRELVLVLIHLGVLVRLDHRRVGECLRHIPILAQACDRFLFITVYIYKFENANIV